MLTCDFNTRTRVLSDYSEHDSHKYISLPLNYKLDSSLMRYNSDHSINIVMEERIGSNLHNIVNRRINRDRNVRGDFTCYTPRECSVV